jgi:hypothetical protein
VPPATFSAAWMADLISPALRCAASVQKASGRPRERTIGDTFHEVGVDYFFPGGTGGIGGDWAGLESPWGVTEHAILAGRESIPGGPIHGGWRVLGSDPVGGGMNRTRPNRVAQRRCSVSYFHLATN